MKPTANPKRTLIESLQVGLAWDSQIKEWAERELPNGEVVGRVKNAQTVNYKTLKPVKDGLFCEKIFGPIKDFECACGFKQTRGGFCPQCNVEFTRSEVRRYRLGYFQLPSAVTHVWYLRGRPSYISYLLGIKIKKALALTYGAASLLVNSQHEKVISQEENESLTFSFTAQTLYSVGECKGKTVPRSQIRRYNPNHFLFDKKRAKLIKNLFRTFIYTPRTKNLPTDLENKSQDKHYFHALPKSVLAQETNLQDFYKEKQESTSWSSQKENLKTSSFSLPNRDLTQKQHDLSTANSYITKAFFFSSAIRGGWQPLIVVNLQDKLPVNLSYKKAHPKYYKFKKYLKFSQNLGFYAPTVQKQEDNQSPLKINRSGTHEEKTGVLSNRKNKLKKILVGVDKNKELSLSTLIFYPIRKEVNKLQEEKSLIKTSSQLSKIFYQELDFKFKSLNYIEKANNQIGFSSISEKKVDLQDRCKEQELADFRSMFHFIGQPCQLKKKSRFLVHTASNFSQTRNRIFRILEKEKSINSVHFGHKLAYYGDNLKDKYRVLNNSVKKKYRQNHLFPYLFSLSCQSKNYQYLQTYSNFFIPTLPNSEKILLISSYKNQTKKNQYINLYNSFIKNKFTISTPFSCSEDSLTISLKDLTNVISMDQGSIAPPMVSEKQFAEGAMHSSVDSFTEKKIIESPESLVELKAPLVSSEGSTKEFVYSQNKYKKIGDDEGIEKNKNIGLQNEFEGKEALYLQNRDSLKDWSRIHDQVSEIFGEIPLVLTRDAKPHQNIFRHKKKDSKYLQQKKDVLQNKTPTFQELKKKARFLQNENSAPFPDLQRNSDKRKGLSSKLQNKPLPEILVKLNKDSPTFLQNINIDSFLKFSKNLSFLRGFLIKKPFFVETKSRLFKNFAEQKHVNTLHKSTDFFSGKNIGPTDKLSRAIESLDEQANALDLQNKPTSTKNPQKTHNFISAFDKKYRKLKKIELFEDFAEQNFPSGWRARKQIKKILKTATILKNFKGKITSPISSIEWSYLSKKPNKEDYLFSIYEMSVQQALGYTCGESILKLLSPINCYQLESGLKVVLCQINERISEVEDQGFLLKSDLILLNSLRTKKSRTLRRLKIAKILRKTKVLPKQMVFSLLPVLPPSLRPIIQLDENIVAVSDCSQIYQKIVQRSNRLSKRMSKYLSYDHCLRLKVLLQQAVDGLIENGKGGSKPLCDNNGRPLKSLSDGLKGKKGRFRQDLLGRRVDYSGRSVIVVGPALKLHQCGLPKEMAIELFQPFLIRQLFAKKIVSNIAVAKNYIKKETPIVLEILKQLLRSHPVLLNRAPTLHRLGVQAFQPKLVSGRAILLHPLVCSAFNADFDGDQMAVHIPLSSKARGEAWKILWSRNNILSPATGQPILVPSQDMVLGCYYLTTKKANFLTKKYSGVGKKDTNKQSLGDLRSNCFSETNASSDSPSKNIAEKNLISPKEKLRSRLDSGNTLSKPNLSHSHVTNGSNLSVRPKPKKDSIRRNKRTGQFFNNSYQVLKDLQQKRLKLHTSIWLKMDRDVEIHKEEQKPLEARIHCCGNFTKIYPGYLRRFYKREGLFFKGNLVKKPEDFYVRTTCGRVMLNQTISPILHQPF